MAEEKMQGAPCVSSDHLIELYIDETTGRARELHMAHADADE